MKIDLNNNEIELLTGLFLDAIEDADEDLEKTAFRNLYDKLYGCLDESTECCKTLKDAVSSPMVRLMVGDLSVEIFR